MKSIPVLKDNAFVFFTFIKVAKLSLKQKNDIDINYSKNNNFLQKENQ